MDQYLLQILKETNTIIIPELGALTITNATTGEVMFMPFLKHDDGKLSAHIAEKEGIEENEAKNIVAKHVREIKTTLDKGDSYDMFEFGTFSKGSDGDIEFENWTGEKKTEAPKVEKPKAATPPKKEEKKEEPKPVETPKAEKPKATAPPKKEEKKAEPKVEEKPKAEAKKETPKPKTVKEEKPVTKKDEKVVEKPKAEVKPKAEPKAPAKETPKAATPPPVKSEPKTAKTVTPVVPAKPAPPKKDMNIAEKEELKKTTDKLDKLKKEKAEKKPKKKRGVGFYMLMVFILIIVAGGTYVAIDYDNVKQHFSFLADAEEEKDEKKPIDEMKEAIGEEETTDEESVDELIEEQVEEELIEEEPIEEPIVEEPEPEPVVTNSGSNDQPFHIVAGAFTSPENAARLAEKIKGMGYPAKVIVRGAQNIVSVQSYATKAEAQAAIPGAQDAAPKGWVLEWR